MDNIKFKDLDSLEFLEDGDVIEITRKELINFAKDKCCTVVLAFMDKCETMAKENWCDSQIEMLERVFEKVLKGEPYAQQPEEE